MRSSRLLLPVAVVSLLATVACGSADPGGGSGQPTRTGPQSSAAAPVPTATSGVATPDATQADALLSALRAVDPALALDRDTAVGKAVAVCDALTSGTSPEQAVTSTFDEADLDASQAAAVAAAVTSTFCTGAETSGGTASSTSS